MPASTILVLESAAIGDASLAPILVSAGYTVTQSSDPGEALALVAAHQLVAIDVGAGLGGKTGFELCHEVRATPSMVSIPILCVAASDDVEERISFLEAGADDVVARPFDAREVEARVEALLLRFQRSKDLAPVVSPDGLTLARPRRSVAVYSPKGGVGTTTIATNVAVAAAQRNSDRVILVDLDLQFGGVATHLNLEPKLTIADAVRDEAAMREPDLLRTYTVRHDSGLHVLAAPVSPEASELITPDHISHILGTLLEGYDGVVIDAGSILDEGVLRIFEIAETILLPVHPEMAALKAMHGLLDYLNETGSINGKSTFVLNNMFAREILKPRDIEAALGSRITTDLPYDPFLFLKAVNEGVPIVLGAPRSPAAEQLVRLSTSAFGSDGYAVPDDGPAKRQRRFGFGRRG
ncbi:MAG TPA: AAA family ATPase [Candidatus Limnocylindrales bacterium]|nr:AAA family ATPase [Candidatus Limnocylindrales bacterium]